MAVERGLDAAIVHAAKILPLTRIAPEAVVVAEDLIFDRRREGYDPLTRLLELFEGAQETRPDHEALVALPLTSASRGASSTATATAWTTTSSERWMPGTRRWTSSTSTCWPG